MTTLTEGIHTGEFLLSEGNGFISREKVIVTQTGVALKSGTVLAKLTATGKYVAYDDVGTDGSETAVAILYTELPAFTGDVKAVVIARQAEVKAVALTGTIGAYATDLAAVGIIVR